MVRFLQYLASGRSWAIVDRQPAVAVPSESSPTEAHIVATLPYARHAFLPSAPNIPKSATATWGHLNKNLMWKVTNSPAAKTRSVARSCRVLSCIVSNELVFHYFCFSLYCDCFLLFTAWCAMIIILLYFFVLRFTKQAPRDTLCTLRGHLVIFDGTNVFRFSMEVWGKFSRLTNVRSRARVFPCSPVCFISKILKFLRFSR